MRLSRASARCGLGWVYLDAIIYFSFHFLIPRKTLHDQPAANFLLEILVGYSRLFGFQPIHHHSNFHFFKKSIHSSFFHIANNSMFTVPLKAVLFLFNGALVKHDRCANAAAK
jgi:hypothetical protein